MAVGVLINRVRLIDSSPLLVAILLHGVALLSIALGWFLDLIESLVRLFMLKTNGWDFLSKEVGSRRECRYVVRLNRLEGTDKLCLHSSR